MADSKTSIIEAIEKHVGQCGNEQYGWYVGITNDASRRLFSEHGVDHDRGAWIYRTAYSAQVAREVETYFLARGFNGGTGGGDDDADIVYAYKITDSTKEE